MVYNFDILHEDCLVYYVLIQASVINDGNDVTFYIDYIGEGIKKNNFFLKIKRIICLIAYALHCLHHGDKTLPFRERTKNVIVVLYTWKQYYQTGMEEDSRCKSSSFWNRDNRFVYSEKTKIYLCFQIWLQL